MAGTIPNHVHDPDSTEPTVTPTEWTVDTQGTVLGVGRASDGRRRWRPVFLGLTFAEYQALDALYESNRSASGSGNTPTDYTSPFDGATYAVYFLARPRPRWPANPQGTVDVRLELAEA